MSVSFFVSVGFFVSIRPFAPVGPSVPASASVSIDSSMLTGFWVPAIPLMPANSFALADLIPSSHTSLLIIQDMTKSFFIGKPVIAADNISSQIYTKNIIWISGLAFPNLNKAW